MPNGPVERREERPAVIPRRLAAEEITELEQGLRLVQESLRQLVNYSQSMEGVLVPGTAQGRIDLLKQTLSDIEDRAPLLLKERYSDEIEMIRGIVGNAAEALVRGEAARADELTRQAVARADRIDDVYEIEMNIFIAGRAPGISDRRFALFLDSVEGALYDFGTANELRGERVLTAAKMYADNASAYNNIDDAAVVAATNKILDFIIDRGQDAKQGRGYITVEEDGFVMTSLQEDLATLKARLRVGNIALLTTYSADLAMRIGRLEGEERMKRQHEELRNEMEEMLTKLRDENVWMSVMQAEVNELFSSYMGIRGVRVLDLSEREAEVLRKAEELRGRVRAGEFLAEGTTQWFGEQALLALQQRNLRLAELAVSLGTLERAAKERRTSAEAYIGEAYAGMLYAIRSGSTLTAQDDAAYFTQLEISAMRFEVDNLQEKYPVEGSRLQKERRQLVQDAAGVIAERLERFDLEGARRLLSMVNTYVLALETREGGWRRDWRDSEPMGGEMEAVISAEMQGDSVAARFERASAVYDIMNGAAGLRQTTAAWGTRLREERRVIGQALTRAERLALVDLEKARNLFTLATMYADSVSRLGGGSSEECKTMAEATLALAGQEEIDENAVYGQAVDGYYASQREFIGTEVEHLKGVMATRSLGRDVIGAALELALARAEQGDLEGAYTLVGYVRDYYGAAAEGRREGWRYNIFGRREYQDIEGHMEGRTMMLDSIAAEMRATRESEHVSAGQTFETGAIIINETQRNIRELEARLEQFTGEIRPDEVPEVAIAEIIASTPRGQPVRIPFQYAVEYDEAHHLNDPALRGVGLTERPTLKQLLEACEIAARNGDVDNYDLAEAELVDRYNLISGRVLQANDYRTAIEQLETLNTAIEEMQGQCATARGAERVSWTETQLAGLLTRGYALYASLQQGYYTTIGNRELGSEEVIRGRTPEAAFPAEELAAFLADFETAQRDANTFIVGIQVAVAMEDTTLKQLEYLNSVHDTYEPVARDRDRMGFAQGAIGAAIDTLSAASRQMLMFRTQLLNGNFEGAESAYRTATRMTTDAMLLYRPENIETLGRILSGAMVGRAEGGLGAAMPAERYVELLRQNVENYSSLAAQMDYISYYTEQRNAIWEQLRAGPQRGRTEEFTAGLTEMQRSFGLLEAAVFSVPANILYERRGRRGERTSQEVENLQQTVLAQVRERNFDGAASTIDSQIRSQANAAAEAANKEFDRKVERWARPVGMVAAAILSFTPLAPIGIGAFATYGISDAWRAETATQRAEAIAMLALLGISIGLGAATRALYVTGTRTLAAAAEGVEVASVELALTSFRVARAFEYANLGIGAGFTVYMVPHAYTAFEQGDYVNGVSTLALILLPFGMAAGRHAVAARAAARAREAGTEIMPVMDEIGDFVDAGVARARTLVTDALRVETPEQLAYEAAGEGAPRMRAPVERRPARPVPEVAYREAEVAGARAPAAPPAAPRPGAPAEAPPTRAPPEAAPAAPAVTPAEVRAGRPPGVVRKIGGGIAGGARAAWRGVRTFTEGAPVQAPETGPLEAPAGPAGAMTTNINGMLDAFGRPGVEPATPGVRGFTEAYEQLARVRGRAATPAELAMAENRLANAWNALASEERILVLRLGELMKIAYARGRAGGAEGQTCMSIAQRVYARPAVRAALEMVARGDAELAAALRDVGTSLRRAGVDLNALAREAIPQAELLQLIPVVEGKTLLADLARRADETYATIGDRLATRVRLAEELRIADLAEASAGMHEAEAAVETARTRMDEALAGITDREAMAARDNLRNAERTLEGSIAHQAALESTRELHTPAELAAADARVQSAHSAVEAAWMRMERALERVGPAAAEAARGLRNAERTLEDARNEHKFAEEAAGPPEQRRVSIEQVQGKRDSIINEINRVDEELDILWGNAEALEAQIAVLTARGERPLAQTEYLLGTEFGPKERAETLRYLESIGRAPATLIPIERESVIRSARRTLEAVEPANDMQRLIRDGLLQKLGIEGSLDSALLSVLKSQQFIDALAASGRDMRAYRAALEKGNVQEILNSIPPQLRGDIVSFVGTLRGTALPEYFEAAEILRDRASAVETARRDSATASIPLRTERGFWQRRPGRALSWLWRHEPVAHWPTGRAWYQDVYQRTVPGERWGVALTNLGTKRTWINIGRLAFQIGVFVTVVAFSPEIARGVRSAGETVGEAVYSGVGWAYYKLKGTVQRRIGEFIDIFTDAEDVRAGRAEVKERWGIDISEENALFALSERGKEFLGLIPEMVPTLDGLLQPGERLEDLERILARATTRQVLERLFNATGFLPNLERFDELLTDARIIAGNLDEINRLWSTAREGELTPEARERLNTLLARLNIAADDLEWAGLRPGQRLTMADVAKALQGKWMERDLLRTFAYAAAETFCIDAGMSEADAMTAAHFLDQNRDVFALLWDAIASRRLPVVYWDDAIKLLSSGNTLDTLRETADTRAAESMGSVEEYLPQLIRKRLEQQGLLLAVAITGGSFLEALDMRAASDPAFAPVFEQALKAYGSDRQTLERLNALELGDMTDRLIYGDVSSLADAIAGGRTPEVLTAPAFLAEMDPALLLPGSADLVRFLIRHSGGTGGMTDLIKWISDNRAHIPNGKLHEVIERIMQMPGIEELSGEDLVAMVKTKTGLWPASIWIQTVPPAVMASQQESEAAARAERMRPRYPAAGIVGGEEWRARPSEAPPAAAPAEAAEATAAVTAAEAPIPVTAERVMPTLTDQQRAGMQAFYGDPTRCGSLPVLISRMVGAIFSSAAPTAEEQLVREAYGDAARAEEAIMMQVYIILTSRNSRWLRDQWHIQTTGRGADVKIEQIRSPSDLREAIMTNLVEFLNRPRPRSEEG